MESLRVPCKTFRRATFGTRARGCRPLQYNAPIPPCNESSQEVIKVIKKVIKEEVIKHSDSDSNYNR